MKNNKIIGLIIIFVGVMLAGGELGLWNATFISRGWWTLILIIPAIKALQEKEYKVGTVYLTLGAFLLLVINNIITWGMLLPYIIIMCGLMYIIPDKEKIKDESNKEMK